MGMFLGSGMELQFSTCCPDLLGSFCAPSNLPTSDHELPPSAPGTPGKTVDVRVTSKRFGYPYSPTCPVLQNPSPIFTRVVPPNPYNSPVAEPLFLLGQTQFPLPNCSAALQF